MNFKMYCHTDHNLTYSQHSVRLDGRDVILYGKREGNSQSKSLEIYLKIKGL